MQLYRDFRIGIALRAQLHNAASAVDFLLQQFTDPLPLQACVGMLGQGILDQLVFQQVICADVGAALTQTFQPDVAGNAEQPCFDSAVAAVGG